MKAIHYIASTDVKTRPHVTAQWEGDLLVEIVVNNLFGEQLSHAEYLAAWQVANDLKSTREQC